MARILKAKYYQAGNFLNAHIGANPSFTWCSIMERRDLLRKGLMWRVGSRAFINVRRDPWLPHNAGFKLMDPDQIPDHNQVVSSYPSGSNLLG